MSFDNIAARFRTATILDTRCRILDKFFKSNPDLSEGNKIQDLGRSNLFPLVADTVLAFNHNVPPRVSYKFDDVTKLNAILFQAVIIFNGSILTMAQPWLAWYTLQQPNQTRLEDRNLWDYFKRKGPSIFSYIAQEWKYSRDAMPSHTYNPSDALTIVEIVHAILSSLDGEDFKAL